MHSVDRIKETQMINRQIFLKFFVWKESEDDLATTDTNYNTICIDKLKALFEAADKSAVEYPPDKNEGKNRCTTCQRYKTPDEYRCKPSGQLYKTCQSCLDKSALYRKKRLIKNSSADVGE
jgi:hypothetical protein